jgi:cytochrome c oxidase subunit I+III
MATAAASEQLVHVWETPSNPVGWLTTVDHKRIGIRYIVTGFAFFVAGGILALLMRTQLARPEAGFLSPEAYNQLFSMHGTTMIFLFATPIQAGIGNFVVPLMIGARDMAFPRLNAFGYWVFLLAGLFMYSSFLLGAAPDGGWFSYVPLTEPPYSPGPNLDFWTLGLIFLSFSTLAGAINFIVTIFKLRAPGMSMNRLPLFIWAILMTSLAIVFAVPVLTADNVLLEADRILGTHFFDPSAGGNPLLWQHLFWAFGHPDVYIIFLPAVGMVSSIVPVFARRRIVGYTSLVVATVSTGIIAFGLWVHHMFATGLPQVAMSFFSAASMMITIPSGVQIFGWLATLWGGRPILKTPMLFAAGFIVLFVIGGLSGPMLASIPFDWQVTDSYFVVAHFHYVLIGGAVFPIFGALHYWYPKMTGHLLDEGLGQWTFWLMFIGFNLAFFPMHITGLLGMPRRVYTYPPNLGWDLPNLLSTIGAFVLGVGIAIYIVNVLISHQRGREAGPDPWRADTLEWSIPSPPPAYNFATIPVVRSRTPLWDESRDPPTDPRVVQWEHSTTERRETLGTSILNAEADEILRMPGESWWPLIVPAGLAITTVGLVALYPIVAGLGVVIAAIGVIGWLWPRTEEASDPRAEEQGGEA